MRSITLSKSGLSKLKSHGTELKVNDFSDSVKSLPPGEWCLFVHAEERWVGFINPQIEEKFPCAQILTKISPAEVSKFSPDGFVELKIREAFKKRLQFKGYEEGARIFYGMSDGLPGLIVDLFKNAVIIQINTSGIDRYRDLITKLLQKITSTKTYFLDNPKYREKEFLPTFDSEALPNLDIVENKFKYHIRSEVLQKVGFYYDHRENRKQLTDILNRLSIKAGVGIDLFSYAGAWGINASAAGVERIDFVDQGDFSFEVQEALKLDNFNDRGSFHRKDVFKFLDEAISENKKYNVILCDPPAFAKSASQKDQALEGYSKLHRKVFKCAFPISLCAFSSCTHYVSHEEFQKNISDSARKEGKKIQLIYTGIQGWDHPISSLDEKTNYIKSYFYIVE